MEFACPSHTCVSHPVSTHSPKNALVRLISESKLAVGVNIMVNGCVMLQQTGKKPRIYPSSPPMTAGIGFNKRQNMDCSQISLKATQLYSQFLGE